MPGASRSQVLRPVPNLLHAQTARPRGRTVMRRVARAEPCPARFKCHCNAVTINGRQF